MSNNAVIIKIADCDVQISKCDFEKIKCHKWHRISSKNEKPYFSYSAWINKKSVEIRLHRFIMNAPIGMLVDHVNMDTTDNRRENLRICTKAENQQNQCKHNNNTSGYKGVCFNKRNRKWFAYINVNRLRKNLGYFNTPQAAYSAYCEAAKKYHGEFARIA